MESRLQFEWYDIENDPEGWDANVSGVGQNLFHRSALLASEQFGREFRRGVVVKRWGASVCVVGGLIRPGGSGGSFTALSFPNRSPATSADLPQALSAWLLAQGVTRIHLGSFDGGVEGYLPAREGEIRERLEFIYDLAIPGAVRAQMASSHHRRKLRKTAQQPMRLEPIGRGQALTMARLGSAWAGRRGEGYGIRRWIESWLYYRRLTQRLALDGSGRLYGLFDRKRRLLSVAYMLERGGSSFYKFGASSREGYELGASIRLFWELADYYPSAGIRLMNLGGVPAEARNEGHEEYGVYRFKAGFGIEPVVRRSLTVEA